MAESVRHSTGRPCPCFGAGAGEGAGVGVGAGAGVGMAALLRCCLQAARLAMRNSCVFEQARAFASI